jgi:hypothetical protein
VLQRVRRAGFTTRYVPDSRVMHIGGASKSVSSRTRTRLPAYWFESRRRYFAVAMLTDLVAVAAHMLDAPKRLMPGRQHSGTPSCIRDLLHHGVLRSRNRGIPPFPSRITRSMYAESTDPGTAPRTWSASCVCFGRDSVCALKFIEIAPCATLRSRSVRFVCR